MKELKSLVIDLETAESKVKELEKAKLELEDVDETELICSFNYTYYGFKEVSISLKRTFIMSLIVAEINELESARDKIMHKIVKSLEMRLK